MEFESNYISPSYGPGLRYELLGTLRADSCPKPLFAEEFSQPKRCHEHSTRLVFFTEWPNCFQLAKLKQGRLKGVYHFVHFSPG